MKPSLSFLRSNFHDLDPRSQEIIYYTFRKLIYPDIYYLFHDHELTEDVIHESFLKAIKKAPELSNTTSIETWVKKIARNTAYDYRRKNKKYHLVSNLELVTDSQICANSTIEDQVENAIRDELLYKALRLLQPNYRQILFLFYIQEKSYKEIVQ